MLKGRPVGKGTRTFRMTVTLAFRSQNAEGENRNETRRDETSRSIILKLHPSWQMPERVIIAPIVPEESSFLTGHVLSTSRHIFPAVKTVSAGLMICDI
jgi:hypothetical protein